MFIIACLIWFLHVFLVSFGQIPHGVVVSSFGKPSIHFFNNLSFQCILTEIYFALRKLLQPLPNLT